MNNDKWFYFTIIAITVCTGLGSLVSEVLDTNRMEACVKSGGQWVRTNDTPYKMECRR